MESIQPTRARNGNFLLENSDKNCCISTLIYIFKLEPNQLKNHTLFYFLIDTYNCLKNADLLHAETIDSLLKSLATESYVTLENFKIFPRNRWFCRFLILTCLENCEDNLINEFTFLLREALTTYQPNRIESEKLLEIIDKFADFIDVKKDPHIATDLLDFVRIANLSTSADYKLREIKRKAMRSLNTQQQKELVNVNYLPLRGISIDDLNLNLNNIENIDLFITRIIEMFSNNIENREGGLLYKKLIHDEDFLYWETNITPQFSEKFQVMDFEGEFFQSLRKYWIPLTLHKYKELFILNLNKYNLPNYLKGYILLEAKRRSIMKDFVLDEYGRYLPFLKLLFSKEETRKLAFAIVGCHVEKKASVSSAETLCMWYFLEGQSVPLNSEEIQILHRFFRQICVTLLNGKMQDIYLRNYLGSTVSFATKLLRTDRKFLGAQILLTLFKGATKEESIINNLLKFEHEEHSGRMFFKFLKRIESTEFAEFIERLLADNKGLCQELCELAKKVIKKPKIINDQFLLGFINASCNTLSIKALEQARNLTSFILEVDQEHIQYKEKFLYPSFYLNHVYTSLYKDLLNLFENGWSQNLTENKLFKASLLLESLKHLAKNAKYNGNSFQGMEHIFPSVAALLQQKNLCQFIMNTNVLQFEHLNKPKLINELIKVIENSNMRRPTMASAELLKCFLNGYNNSYKINLLSETLKKVECAAEIQNLTIRKNPETRLILHALCETEYGYKNLLKETMDYLLEMLSYEQATDAAKSAAINSIDLFMSDNTLYSHTIKYGPRVILTCVRHFENRNWVVRNACVQLQKSLIDRFLGVHIAHNRRNKSIDDLFILFPEIIPQFYRTLITTPLNDSALAVMQFFAESQLKARPFIKEINGLEPFLQAFIVLIKNNSDIYGIFAARAFVSLCLEHDIPDIICHIVDFIIDFFLHVKQKNTVRNLMLVLQELNDKYLNFIKEKPVKPIGFYQISKSLNYLVGFLSQNTDLKQMDLLLIKLYSVRNLLLIFQFMNFQSDVNYTDRIWLNNYVSFLINHCPFDKLHSVLKLMFSKKLPACLQIKVLATLVDRFEKKHKINFPLTEILTVLISNMLEVNDSSNYLLLCFLKVIFLFFEHCQTLDKEFMTKIYDNKIKNIYKTLINFLILNQTDIIDKKFVNLSIKNYQKHLTNFDEDFLQIFSQMLKYIYKCSSCSHEKQIILKITLYLIQEHGIWHFASFICKLNIATPIHAMQKLLEYDFLKNYFDSREMAIEFVKEFYATAVEQNNVAKNTNGTFYEEEICDFVSKDTISRIVLNFCYNSEVKSD